jgi:hypothetical protein
MQDVNVVVVFNSADETVERLALAAAVGAVQGRALIRLRRFHGTPESREYVTPRDPDAEWAHAFVIGGAAVTEEAKLWMERLHKRGGLPIITLEGDTPEAAQHTGRVAAQMGRAAKERLSADS